MTSTYAKPTLMLLRLDRCLGSMKRRCLHGIRKLCLEEELTQLLMYSLLASAYAGRVWRIHWACLRQKGNGGLETKTIVSSTTQKP
jgi:hypothetical protein